MLGDTLRWATELDASGFASGAQRINSSLGEMGFRTSAATMNMGGLGTVIGSLANPMTLVAGAAMALGAGLAASVQAAASWQSSMSGVSKTTGLTGQDLSTLSKELLDMSTRMPAAASEIANVAQVAGSLGIAAQDISSFTEVAIQMGVGFEMSAEQAATAGAKILTAFKLDTTAENMEKLGSVVNAMGDSFAATEPQVLDFLNRASFLNTTMGQTIPQIAALGTVLISTGLDADTAATGLKSFLNMATSETSRKGGLDNWAKLMNISVEELKANLAGDFNQTLIDTANAIAAIEDPVERFQKAVALAGTEGAPALLKLAGQQENLQKALGLTNEEWEKAQSLQKTYAAQSETYNSQMQIFWNVINMAGTELGTVMLPALTESVKQATAFALALIDVGEALSEITGIGQEGGISQKVYDLTGGMLGMTAEQQTLMEEARRLAQEASIGTEMAKEIEENERLQNAGAEAIQVGIDKGVFKEAGTEIGKELGKNAADEFGNEFIAQANFANLSSLAMLDMINSQTTKANEQTATSFEHLGQQYDMIMSKGGSGWYYSLYGKDGLVGQSSDLGDYKKMDPVTAFEKITGFPAPEEGTEAYYQMMADAINAEKVRLENEISKEPMSIDSWISKEAVNDSLANIIDKDPIIQKHKEALEAIAKEDAAAYQSALFGAFGDKADIPSLAEVIASGGKGIADVSAWMANEYQPALGSEMESMNKLWDSGLTANRKIVEEDLKLLQDTFENHSNWFEDWQQDLIEIYRTGDITTDQFLDMWDEYAKKADEAATAASEMVLAADEKFYGSILGSSRTWQDYVNEEGGFVGPTEMYAGYAENKLARMQAAQAVNQQYGVTALGSVGMVAELDTTEALTATEALVADIGAMAPDMVLTLDIDHALTTWVNFFADIETTNPTMHVNVEVDAYADEIAAKVEAAIVEALA